MHWVVVPGNEEQPALRWSLTPLAWSHLTASGLALPVTRLSWDEARSVAASVGGRLPTSAEWTWMAAGAEGRRFPWGWAEWTPRHANIRASAHGRPVPVGQCPDGATPEGLLDVGGNVWEWTTTRSSGGRGVVIRGGSYQSPARYATCTYVNAVPPELRSPGIGLRVVQDL